MGEGCAVVATLLLVVVVVTCDDYYDETTLEPWLRRSTVSPPTWATDRGQSSGLLQKTARTWMREVPPGTRLVDARPSGAPYTWLPQHIQASTTAAYRHSNYEDESATSKKTTKSKNKIEKLTDEQSDYEETATSTETRKRKKKSEKIKSQHSDDEGSDYEDETATSWKTRTRKKKDDNIKNEIASGGMYTGLPQQRRARSTAAYRQLDESATSKKTKTRKKKIKKIKDDHLDYEDEIAATRKTRTRRKKSGKINDHQSDDDGTDHEDETVMSRKTKRGKNKTEKNKDEILSGEPHTSLPQNSDIEEEMAAPDAVFAAAPRKTMISKNKTVKKESSRVKTNKRKTQVDIQEGINTEAADEKEHDTKGDKSKSKAKLRIKNKLIITEEESTTMSSRKIKNRTVTSLQSKPIRRKTKAKGIVEEIASDASTNISTPMKEPINKSRMKEPASRKKIDAEYVTNESLDTLNPPQVQIRKIRRKPKVQSTVDSNLPTNEEASKRTRNKIKPRNKTETDIDLGSNVAKTKSKIKLKAMSQKTKVTLTNKEKLLEKEIPIVTSLDDTDPIDTDDSLDDTYAEIKAQEKSIAKLEREGKIKIQKRPEWMLKEPSSRISLSEAEIKSRLSSKVAGKRGRYRKEGDKLDGLSEWNDGLSRPWDNEPSKIKSKSSAKRGENKEDSLQDTDRSRKRDESTRNADELPKRSRGKYKNVAKGKRPDPDIAFKAFNEREIKRQPKARNAKGSYNRESEGGYRPQDYRAGERRYYRGRAEDVPYRESDRREPYQSRSRYSEDTYGKGREGNRYDRRDDYADRRRDDADSRRSPYRPTSRTDDKETRYRQRDPDSRRGKAASRSRDYSERRTDAGGRRGPSSGTYDRRSYSKRDSGPRGAASGARRAYSKKDVDDKRTRNKKKTEKRKLKLKNRLKTKKAKGGRGNG